MNRLVLKIAYARQMGRSSDCDQSDLRQFEPGSNTGNSLLKKRIIFRSRTKRMDL